MSKVRWFIDQERVELAAYCQVMRTASMPFVEGIAVMPDVHYGKGSTVGTVVATRGAVMPACVGVDIGCGMIAVRTSLSPESVRPHLAAIREGIERRIPVGIGGRGQNSKMTKSASLRVGELLELSDLLFGSMTHMDARSTDWKNQLGSLGGGNHFIEVCVGRPMDAIYSNGLNEGSISFDRGLVLRHSQDAVWVILHSGSRGVGNRTGTHWTRVARSEPKHYMNGVDLPDIDLAALIVGSDSFGQYMRELMWCQEFARLNREEMMDRVLTEFPITSAVGVEVERVNCHHNYVEYDPYARLFITRKGAISATPGSRGLIPGSMGAASYIVEGLGNTESYCSAPHGAGRRMSRGQARRTFTLDQVREQMWGIEARVREAIVDEAPGAYKDINQVMEDARDLVRPTHMLRQLISVKGD